MALHGADKIKQEDNLRAMCVHLNTLIQGFQVKVRADLNGTDCEIGQLVPDRDEIDLYDLQGQHWGTYPGNTFFTVRLP